MGQALKAIFFEMGDTVALTLEQLNAASAAEAVALLDGVYEHSPWIAEAALAQRPSNRWRTSSTPWCRCCRRPARTRSWP